MASAEGSTLASLVRAAIFVGLFALAWWYRLPMTAYLWVRSVKTSGPSALRKLASLAIAASVVASADASLADAAHEGGPLRTHRDVVQPKWNPSSVTASDDAVALITLAAPQRLIGSDVATGDYEGASVSFDGDTAVVAAPFAAPMGRTDAGAVYVFVRNGAAWTQQAKIIAGDGRNGDNFGARVALRGDTLVIGAPGADVFGRSNAGAAYVYQRAGSTWYPSAKLVASDAAAEDQLGFAVAVDGDSVVAGARSADVAMRKDAGAAYVFSRRGPMWFQTAKLTASDAAANDSFGVGVAMSGDYVLVGSDFAEIAGKTDAGAAYVFQRGAMGFVQQAKLTPSDGQSNDWFGRQVALDGTTAIISSLYGDATGKPNSGSAYIFTRGATGWSQQAKLTATDTQSNDWFGYDVACSGSQVLVGAPFADLPMLEDAGAAYSFVRSGSAWTQTNKLTASDPTSSGFFGNGVSLDGDTFLVGAPRRPVGGAAYAFIDRKGNGEPCLNSTECVSGFCVDGVCCNSACGSGTVDCQACSIAAGAQTDGQCAPVRGGTVCRTAQGSCDLPETCSGTSIQCPVDVRKPRGSICRASAHGCDAEERCDGTNPVCPSDGTLENGTSCELGSCQLGQCRAEAELSLSWNMPTATVERMDPITLPLLLKNQGKSAAFDVTLRIEAPERTQLSLSAPGFSCTQDAAVLDCVVANLPVGEQSLSVTLVPPPVLREFSLLATVRSLSIDPEDKNNQAMLSVRNDNPVFEQIAGGGRGCTVGGPESSAGLSGLLAVSSLLGGLIIRRRQRRSPL